MNKKFLYPLLLAAAVTLPGCSSTSAPTGAAVSTPSQSLEESASSAHSAQGSSSIHPDDMFTERDRETDYEAASCIEITLNGSGASCSSSAVQTTGSRVTITEAGSYLISGHLDDGMILINADDTAKIQLILNNVQITNSTSAAIYVQTADKVFITMAEGSENTLSNGGTYRAIDDRTIDSVIFAASDLTLNGSGSLNILANAGHGIVSKDDLVITGGSYEITAARHGLSGKDSVRIADGVFHISSGKDGIQAEHDSDASLGFLYIQNGDFQIRSDGDGISASSALLIEDGTFDLKTGGGCPETSAKAAWPEGEHADTDTVSTKGIKAGTELTLTNGTFQIDSADDSLHSNGTLTISGGNFTIASGDDGIHGDAAVAISDGSIQITQSYEGIEGASIQISGGDIHLISSDDGLNAAGDDSSAEGEDKRSEPFAAQEGVFIEISGGTLQIDASGDGMDSNGDLTVSGGEIYLSGPENGADSALDYNGEAVITGGTVIATGSSGMAQNFGSDSTQGSILVSVDSGTAGSDIILYDASGSVLLSWQSTKNYTSVLVSCPQITEGAAYTLTAGDSSTEITMEGLIYGSSGNPGGGPGGGRPDGNRPAGGPGGGPGGNRSAGRPDGGPGGNRPAGGSGGGAPENGQDGGRPGDGQPKNDLPGDDKADEPPAGDTAETDGANG